MTSRIDQPEVSARSGRVGLATLPLHTRPGAGLAVRAHGAPRARDPGPRGRRLWPGRGAGAAVRPVLVPGVRLRARLRLAFQRRHHHDLRRDQGGGARARGRLRLRRRRRQGRGLAQDARRDRARLRAAGAGSGGAGQGEPALGQGRQHRGAGRPSALPPLLPVHARRRLVRDPAGHVRRGRHGAALPLAGRSGDELRRGAACRGLRRCRGPDAQPGRRGERGGARGDDRDRRPAAGGDPGRARSPAAAADAGAPSAAGRGRHRSEAAAPDPAQDLRAAARRLRGPARRAGPGAEEPARADPGRGADPWRPRQHARPGALRLRPRRQGRHAVPGRPRDLRPDDRAPARRARPRQDRPLRPVAALKRLAVFGAAAASPPDRRSASSPAPG